MATHLRTELVLDALDMALWQRRPEAVIHHSDQGTRATPQPRHTHTREALCCNDFRERGGFEIPRRANRGRTWCALVTSEVDDSPSLGLPEFPVRSAAMTE